MGDVDIKNLPRGDLCHGLGVEMFSQTIPHPMKADFFPVYEGFLAWASILTIAIAFLVTRRISFILLLFVVIISTIISEGIFPNVGDVSLQARPRENCIGKNGFPSGHTQQLTTIWAYLTFDTIFKHGWSAPKKIILLITWLLLFIPNGPSRWAVGDHKWFQIGAGYGIGFAIGLLGWLLVRFVIGRFLEDIMCLGIIRRLRLVNDYDPNYEHSRHKGKKYQETIRKDESKPQNNFITKAWNHFTAPGHSKWQDLKEWQYLLIMLPIPITLFVVGAVGIAASYWKGDLTPDCDISAPEVMLATNALTIFQGGLVCVAIGFGIYRYQASEPDKHVLNQYIWLFICANMIECYIFNYAGYIANDPTEDGNLTKCPPGGDIGSHYVTIWFVVITAMLAYFVIVWFILRLFTLYTNRIEMWPTDRTKKDQPPTQARPPMNGNGNGNGNGHMNRPDIQEQRTTTSMIGQPGPTGTPLTKRGPFVPQV